MDMNRFFEPIRIGCSLNTLRQSTSIQSYNSLFNPDNERLCSICQSNYINNQIIRKINHCGHFYHINCLDEWFENNVKCPECQYDLRESIPRNNNDSDIFTFLLPNATSTPIPNTQPTAQTLDRLLQNIISNYRDTDISVEYFVPTINTMQTPQTTQPQPQQSTVNMPMDITTNNTNTRTSRNRRNRNKKNQNQKEKLEYIMNYQQENIAKMDFFEKELESLRLQLEDCKITNNNKYNPFNVFKYFWN